MEAVALMLISFVGYLVAYHTYGKFLARKIFKLKIDRQVPSRELEDGVDFIPTRKGIIFGHHYTSIAGTGPIVGPAIGIIWGWIPAMIWIFFGSIFMGAVHDLGSLVLSMRNKGESLSEFAARYVNQRMRYIAFLIIFLELLIIIAIFGLIIAVIFQMFPQSVFPVWMEIPIAVTLGWLIYKRSANILISTTVAVTLMYTTVFLGHYLPFSMPAIGGLPATGVWTIILLIYAGVASVIPVNRLLQPRDYINAWQLFIAMGALVVGILGSGLWGKLEMVAPALNVSPAGAPPLLPFLFITIACGALSGFHAVVSSGTTSKQIASEPDALFVGYGSMLMEAILATLVIIAVGAGIGLAYQQGDGSILTGTSAWHHHYASWASSQGLASKINAVVIGSANMMESIWIPKSLGIIVIGVFIASFAGTTLDSATRIQRYVITELFRDMKLKKLTNRYTTTAFVILTAAALAFITGADGKGALTLWPLFGAVNQLLAGMALIVITIYLRKKRKGLKYLITAIPALIILVMTIWAIFLNEFSYWKSGHGLLVFINAIVFCLAIWMVIEGLAFALKKTAAS
ncbi:MAG: carbon starvation protein A [Candidatus Marinimicrobia bacterium]|nr:carbon starvation protein A [Candidatus Neomarinimicrobiota bacterium]MCF7921656.1 carbon starvation protein A [Candidatus Neomarinimicrobiota bacterium]